MTLYKGTTSNLKVYNFNFRTLCQRTITEIASFCHFVNICILIFFKISSSLRFFCVCFRHQSPKHLPARRHKKKEKHNFDLCQFYFSIISQLFLTNLYYFNLQVLLEKSTDQADVLSSGELMDTDGSQDKEVQV